MKDIRNTTYARSLFFITGLLILSLATKGSTQTPEEIGLEIAIEMDKRDSGFGDMKATMKMILKNRQGEESIREMKLISLEVDGDGDKSLTTFNTPRDVKGTSFLSHTHVKGPDDQWLFLPALKRVKRISSNNKSGPFMGSEFAYEDLTSQEVEKYTYKYIKDDSTNSMLCFQVERYPVDKKSGYTRQVVWIDKEEYRPQKIDFYDRKNSLLKTLVFLDYQQYLLKFWRASKMKMQNHQTGKTTLLEWNEIVFKNGLNDRDFDKKALKRSH